MNQMNQMNQMSLINQMISYNSTSNNSYNNEFPIDDIRNHSNNLNLNKGNNNLNFNPQKMGKASNMNIQNQKPNFNSNIMYVNNMSNRNNNINKKNINNNGIYQGNNGGQTKMKYVKSDKSLVSSISNIDQDFKSGANKNWRGYNAQNNQNHLNNLLNTHNISNNLSSHNLISNTILGAANSNSIPINNIVGNVNNNSNNNNFLNQNNMNISNFNSVSASNKINSNSQNLTNNLRNNNNITNNELDDPNFSEEKYFVNEDNISPKDSPLLSNDNSENQYNQLYLKNQANSSNFIKIVMKLSENKTEIFEVQKNGDIVCQIKEFCMKNNVNSELIKPIYNYVIQSINTLGLLMEKKVDNRIIENLQIAKNKFEEIKEIENNYHSDSEIYLHQLNNCEISTIDSNTSY